MKKILYLFVVEYLTPTGRNNSWCIQTLAPISEDPLNTYKRALADAFRIKRSDEILLSFTLESSEVVNDVF